MKKSCKIFSAVALSAVLTMGTAVPAFAVADPQASGTSNANETSNTATTNVSIATYSSSYSVTVPLKLPFVLDQVGGPNSVSSNFAPTNYYIQNNGAAAVQIDKIEWDLSTTTNGDTTKGFYYTFGKTWSDSSSLATTGGGTITDSSWHATIYKDNESDTDYKVPRYGSFIIQMTPDVADPADATVAATGTVVQTKADGFVSGYMAQVGKAKDGSTDAMGTGYTPWKFNAASADKRTANSDPNPKNTFEAGKYFIGLKIWNTMLNGAEEKSLEDVASIIYTVAPAS